MKVIISKNYILECPQYNAIRPNIELCKNLKCAFLDIFWVNFIERIKIKRIVDNENSIAEPASIVQVLLDIIEESKKFAYFKRTEDETKITYEDIYKTAYVSYVEALTLNEVVNDEYIEIIDGIWDELISNYYIKGSKRKKISLIAELLTHDVQYDKEFLKDFMDRARTTAIAFKSL